MGSAPSVNTGDIAAEAAALAAQQQGYDVSDYEMQQAGNQVNQITPFGSLDYTQIGTGPNGVPIYSANTTLSPEQQYLLNMTQGTQSGAATQANELLNNTNYAAPNNIGGMTSGITGQMLGAEFGAMSPYFNQQTEAMQSELANQGLTPTDPAYQAAMNNLMQSQNQSMFGYEAQAEPQAFSQAQTLYQEPLQIEQELAQQGEPASLTQQLISTPTNVANVPNVAAAYQAASSPELAEAQLQEQQYGSTMAGLGQLGSSALLGGLLLSDERLKKDIRKVGDFKRGVGLYRFKSVYDDSEHVGVLANEVSKTYPHLVHEIDGVKFVDYDGLKETA